MSSARPTHRRPLPIAVLYTGAGFLPLFLVSAQIFQLERDLGFGVGQLAIASTTFMASSAIASALSGGIVARIGPTRGLRIGAGLTTTACLISATAATGWLIPLATGIGGLSNGFTQVSANLAIFDGVRSGRQGIAYGTKQSAVPLSSLVAGLALPAVGLAVGWRWTFAGAGALALLLAATVPRFDTTRIEERAETSRGRLPASLLPLALAGFTGAFAGNAAALFVVPSAVDVGMDEAAAGTVLAACSVLVVAVRIGAGWTVDRRRSSGHMEMMALAGTGAVGALALAGVDSPSLYLVAMPLALLGAWGWPGVFFFTIVNSFSDIPARASGLLMAGNFTGTVVGPLAVGYFAARDAYPTAWLMVGGAAALSAAGFALTYRRRQTAAAITEEGGL
ncbi:MAG: MFS transporter [Actinomycetota bacterium]